MTSSILEIMDNWGLASSGLEMQKVSSTKLFLFSLFSNEASFVPPSTPLSILRQEPRQTLPLLGWAVAPRSFRETPYVPLHHMNSSRDDVLLQPRASSSSAVSKLTLEAVQEVRKIISPPKDKPYYKLKEELVRRTSMSRQKKLSQLLHEEQLGDSKPSIELEKHLPSVYHAVLVAVGEDAPVEKLAKIADNVADLTSRCTAPVSAVQTQEPDPLARLLEGQRSPPLLLQFATGKSLGWRPEATRCAGVGEVCRLLFVSDRTTGIRFLVDSGAQISLSPATRTDMLKGPHKLTLQAVNKSLIQTYGQRCLTLNLGLRRVFTHFFVLADVEKAILGADFLHKFVLLIDVHRRCLTDPKTNTQSPGAIHNVILLCPTVANREDNPMFCEHLKKFESITKPSFHKDSLPHNITHHITTSGPLVHSRPRRLAREKNCVTKAEFTQIMELGIIRPSKIN
ncbi:unnamed protein product [Acanthosepion pharaonis]|uniref:DUF7041 domain-containing protein n=1 Tax=Acanthosepion pharaonis TaxID=158019 RepID=A0A812B6G0_ACAPH|nr:unnamed protein product [Sepia pharaonis]